MPADEPTIPDAGKLLRAVFSHQNHQPRDVWSPDTKVRLTMYTLKLIRHQTASWQSFYFSKSLGVSLTSQTATYFLWQETRTIQTNRKLKFVASRYSHNTRKQLQLPTSGNLMIQNFEWTAVTLSLAGEWKNNLNGILPHDYTSTFWRIKISNMIFFSCLF